jgi:hypothetical protein
LLLSLIYCHPQKIEKNKDEVAKSLFETFVFSLKKNDFNQYLIYIKKTSVLTGDNEILHPEECWIECDGKRIDFAPVEIETNAEYSIPLSACLFSVETRKNISNGNCGSVNFVANRQNYILTLNFIPATEKFAAFPQELFLDDTTIVFVLDLVRLKPSDEEYFPTSERLRIEIRNQLGKVIWNSDYDLNFLQVVGKVEPIEVGKLHRYIVPWNRRDNQGKLVEAGKYNVAFILPFKPNNLIKFRNLELKAK